MILDLSKIQKIHFSGIGGIGMSALARMMIHEGKTVYGSDLSDSKIIRALVDEGVSVKIGQDAKNVGEDTQLFVYTAALDENNPELLQAKQMGIPVLTYAEMLGQVSRDKRTVAIAGTHGKTTTTAMIAGITRSAMLRPTVIVGSLISGENSNFVAGDGPLFIVEACEYKRSFLNLHPWIGVITNIDNDHLDYYGTLENLIAAFSDFVRLIPENGYLVCNPNGQNMGKVVEAAKCKVIDYMAVGDVPHLQVPGAHNILDAKAAVAVANILNVDSTVTKESLAGFTGTWRRFEFKGTTKNGALVYDDYGHHPTEVKATLSAAKSSLPGKKIIAVFMPHLYSRTKILLKDFGTAFKDADEVIVSEIYPAREPFDPTITSEMVVEEIKKNGGRAVHVAGMESIAKYLTENTKSGDAVITIGAGDIFKVGELILK